MTIATRFPGDRGPAPKKKALRRAGDAQSVTLQRVWTVYGWALTAIVALLGVVSLATSQEYGTSPWQVPAGLLAIVLSPLAAVGPLTIAAFLQRQDRILDELARIVTRDA